MSVISPLKSKHIQILLGAFFSFAVMIFHVRSIAKLGTYWDHQMDDGMAFLTLEWLKNGISIEDETFQLLTPYGYMVTYLMWIPLRVYFSLFSNSEFTIPALETSNILVYRNVFVFGILLIGLYALAVWSQLLIKVSKWFSVALMSMLFPTLAGYGMMNPKDIPVFTGVSCALALSFTSLSNSSVKDKFKNYLWVNCAIFFVLGVRPGAAYLLIVIFSFQTWQAKDRATFFKILLSGIPSLLICYYFSATARNFGILWLWETIQSSSNYTAWQGTMLLWGTPFETPISRLYQIGVLASQIPLFAVIFLLFALFLQIKRNSFRIRMNFETVSATHKILKSPIFLPSLLLV